MKTHFEEIFDEYHDLIRREIASDTELDIKLVKVENMTYMMHSSCKALFSLEYRNKANKFIEILKKGTYYDSEDKQINISFNQPQTKRQRLSFIMEWLSVMIQNDPRLKLDKNLNRVEFGD